MSREIPIEAVNKAVESVDLDSLFGSIAPPSQAKLVIQNKPETPQQTVKADAPVATITQPEAPKPFVEQPKVTETPKPVEPQKEPEVELKTTTEVTEIEPKATEPNATITTEDLLESVTPQKESFKKLRQTLNAVKEEKTTLQKQKEELEAKLKEYESGNIIPEPLKEKEKRIAELERYEQLHNMKMSTAYQEKYVKPITELTQRIGLLAGDYDVDVNELLSAKTERELNEYISDNFDAIGGLEIKNAVNQLKRLQHEAKQAEDTPKKVLEQLEVEHKAIQEQKRNHTKLKIADTVKQAWNEVIGEIEKEGKVLELIPKDPEHTEKIVKPLRENAATEYGKIVRMLTELGIEDMPKELAKALSKMTALAHASGVALETRNRALQRLNELEESSRRTATMVRPRIGSGTGSAVASSGPKTTKPTEAADILLNSVLSQR